MRKVTLGLLSLTLIFCLSACNNTGKDNTNAQNTEATDTGMTGMKETQVKMPSLPADAAVFFKNLKDGDVVTSPVKIEMGAKDVTVEPSGDIHDDAGHHHILIDAGDSIPEGEVIPEDSLHVHFGGGQTETKLDLSPGEHTLTLQFADGAHRSYGSQMAATVKIKVKK